MTDTDTVALGTVPLPAGKGIRGLRQTTAVPASRFTVLATSKSGTHWEPRDQGLDGGLVSSLRALL